MASIEAPDIFQPTPEDMGICLCRYMIMIAISYGSHTITHNRQGTLCNAGVSEGIPLKYYSIIR